MEIQDLQKTQIEKRDIKSMRLEELQEAVASMGQPSFRALQVYRWLHRGVSSFDEMSDLSKSLQAKRLPDSVLKRFSMSLS